MTPSRSLKGLSTGLAHADISLFRCRMLSHSIEELVKKMGLISSCYELTPHDIEIGHKRLYDLDLLKQHINSSGLKVESSGSIFLKPFSNPQMQLLINCEAWGQGIRGWGIENSHVNWADRLCEALYEIAKELPQYSSPIWARCMK